MTPEKVLKPVPVAPSAVDRLEMEMNMFDGWMSYLDTRHPDEAPPTTPQRKTAGQAVNDPCVLCFRAYGNIVEFIILCIYIYLG